MPLRSKVTHPTEELHNREDDMQTKGADDFRDADDLRDSDDNYENRAEPSNGESSKSRALRDLMGKADPTLALWTSQKPDDHFDLPTKKNVEKEADRMSALDT